ncbi:MAG: hypothetical protein ACMUHY_02120, partial [Thermoplasmatota archaeon]
LPAPGMPVVTRIFKLPPAPLDVCHLEIGLPSAGSAASTMFGFAIIGFAPMPMFSSYGILTAVMILMAFVAALFVLPSMLFLVTPDGR